METFYHGTTRLFHQFDNSHALEGDGKAKFGYGTYVTESYTSGGNYSFNKSRPDCPDHYVYTLEIPDMTEDNHLFSVRPVHPSIIERTEKHSANRFLPKHVLLANSFASTLETDRQAKQEL